MRKLQSILLATDFRASSEQAVEVALRLASQFGSHLTLFHAVDSTTHWPGLVHQHRGVVASQMRRIADRFTGQQVLLDEMIIASGHPADSIVRKAEEIDADLILIGAGDRARFENSLLGPTAAAVLQHAAKPVLAVRDGDPTVQFGKILCPVDMSATSARGLANALQLARAFRGELVVVTVVPTPHWLAGFPEIRNLPDGGTSNEHTWRDEFNQFLAMAGVGDIRCEHEIRSGQPHDEIIASARAHGADLIVMGSTGRTGLARILMGSVIRRVIQQLPCSILAVKQQNVLEELHDDELQTIQVLYAQGRGLLGARSYETALERFSHVLLHDPFHAGALAGKAAALDALGRNEEAERCRKRAGMIEEGEKQEFDLGGGD